jgi:hypothetical protein
MKKKLAILYPLILGFCLLVSCGKGPEANQQDDSTATGTPTLTEEVNAAAVDGTLAANGDEPATVTAGDGDSLASEDLVEFGGYEWRVLTEQEGKMLLITDALIGKMPYGPDDTTWETCPLRAYLNGEFYDSFSADERERIVQTSVSNPDNEWHGTAGGEDTEDYIFLLSLAEVVEYFGDSGQFAAKPDVDDPFMTIYDEYGEAWPWWLRSPGAIGWRGAYVHNYGQIVGDGQNVGDYLGIRPAMWVSVE